jgi:hypothetical protein
MLTTTPFTFNQIENSHPTFNHDNNRATTFNQDENNQPSSIRMRITTRGYHPPPLTTKNLLRTRQQARGFNCIIPPTFHQSPE